MNSWILRRVLTGRADGDQSLAVSNVSHNSVSVELLMACNPFVVLASSCMKSDISKAKSAWKNINCCTTAANAYIDC